MLVKAENIRREHIGRCERGVCSLFFVTLCNVDPYMLKMPL
nr:MAG TPA: hypothetical protein [Caudoviricetes sp.]